MKLARGWKVPFGKTIEIREGATDGFFIHTSYSMTYIEYSGMESGTNPTGFQMPNDAKVLRKMASVLRKIAKDIEDREPRPDE
jgi:hypothetical protein